MRCGYECIFYNQTSNSLPSNSQPRIANPRIANIRIATIQISVSLWLKFEWQRGLTKIQSFKTVRNCQFRIWFKTVFLFFRIRNIFLSYYERNICNERNTHDIISCRMLCGNTLVCNSCKLNRVGQMCSGATGVLRSVLRSRTTFQKRICKFKNVFTQYFFILNVNNLQIHVWKRVVLLKLLVTS